MNQKEKEKFMVEIKNSKLYNKLGGKQNGS